MRCEFGIDLLSAFHDLTLRRYGQRRDTHRIRSNTYWPNDPVIVVALLDNRLQRACYSDSVTAHDHRLLFAGLIQEEGFESFAIFGAELEYVTYFDCSLNLERFSTFRAGFAGLHQSQINPVHWLNVAFDGNIAKVKAILVGAGGHGRHFAQSFVGVNREGCSLAIELLLHRTKTAGHRSDLIENGDVVLGFCVRWTEVGSPKHTGKLCFIQLIVAPEQDQHRFAVNDIN